MKKERTAAQLANDERLRNKAKSAVPSADIQPEQGTDEILRQLQELRESNALLKAAFLSNGESGVSLGRDGGVIGVVEKYLVDPAHYPNPTDRLKKEQRLAPLAFEYNYELDYKVALSQYENKGINYKEPKFMIDLNRVVLNDQGEQTPKRYVARKLIFHEDPQAALVIARENGLEIESENEKTFLDEMRYLRVRDWLFGIFWPKPTEVTSGITEEVIGGTIVQVFSKSSEDPSSIDFNQIKTKLV